MFMDAVFARSSYSDRSTSEWFGKFRPVHTDFFPLPKVGEARRDAPLNRLGAVLVHRFADNAWGFVLGEFGDENVKAIRVYVAMGYAPPFELVKQLDGANGDLEKLTQEERDACAESISCVAYAVMDASDKLSAKDTSVKIEGLIKLADRLKAGQ